MHFSKLVMVFSVFLLCATFIHGFFSDYIGSSQKENVASLSTSNNGDKFGSTAVFRVGGNVYPDGYFYATLNIGDPPKPYHVDIDTGSDLAWVHCDAPCVNCPKSPHKPYKPRNNAIPCKEPMCILFQQPENFPCHSPRDQCDYEIEYADHGSSIGVLVKDKIPLRFLNGSIAHPSLVFGCGYDQQYISHSSNPPFVDGVLGLGNAKTSILSQFQNLGIMKNVFSHCFSSRGGGYLLFGDELIPSETVWVPMAKNHIEKFYSMGPAKVLLGGRNVVKDSVLLVLDSGSTYNYLNEVVYGPVLSLIKKNVDSKHLMDAPEDKTLPTCWKGVQPFKSISEVKRFFKPLTFSFPNTKKAVMEIPPESYLILTKNGDICLGILDGLEAGLGNLNVLGDTAFLDKMVIYDNEKDRIGWTSANCDNLPNLDHDISASFSTSEDDYHEL